MSSLQERLRTRFREVVGINEKPERLAAAWALGLAIGLSPFMGLHTVIALLLAFVLRLNKVDVLVGTLVINPWTFPVYFPIAALIGTKVTGVHVPNFAFPHPEEVLHAAMWRQHAPWLRSVLLAWGVGALVFALLAGGITYLLLCQLIRLHRARHHGAG